MTKKRTKRMTLAEHDSLLAAEGRHSKMVERLEQQEVERQHHLAEWRLAETPLVADLRSAGFQVQSAWDFVNTPGTYPKAVPILLEHLPRPYPGPVREGIARALAVPEARVGWDLLTRLYRDEQDARAKDGLAVAIAAAADDTLIEEVIALTREERNGPSRLLLLRVLARSADPRACSTLEGLRADADLKKEVGVILRRLRHARR